MNTNKSLIKNILIALVLAIPFTNYAQIWPKIYGDNLRAYGNDIIESYDKGYTICGSILKDASHFKYGWLIKTDINGNELWNKKFGDGIMYPNLRAEVGCFLSWLFVCFLSKLIILLLFVSFGTGDNSKSYPRIKTFLFLLLFFFVHFC
jgi:hypothetical protein